MVDFKGCLEECTCTTGSCKTQTGLHWLPPHGILVSEYCKLGWGLGTCLSESGNDLESLVWSSGVARGRPDRHVPTLLLPNLSFTIGQLTSSDGRSAHT